MNRNQLIAGGLILVLLAVFGPALLRGADDFDTPARAGADSRLDVAYGEHPRQTYDVYTPATADGPYPAVVWIHGGGWRFGDKGLSMPVWDWTDDGYVVVAVNYRYAIEGETIETSTADVIAAVEHLRQAAPTFDIDPERIGVYGFSAGGHLAAMVAQADLGIAAAVVAGAPTDFEPLVDPERSVFEARATDEAAAVIRTLLGCPGGDCGAEIASLSPARLPAVDVATMIVHGDEDTFVDVDQARAYAARLTADGVDPEVVIVETGGHVILAEDRIEQFLREALAS